MQLCVNICTDPTSAPVNVASVQPTWDDCTNSLYYSDIATSGNQTSLYRYELNEGKLYGAYVEGNLTAFGQLTPVGRCGDNEFIICHGHNVVSIRWDGRSPSAKVIKTVYSVAEDDPLSIVNIIPDNVHGFLMGITFNRQYCIAPKTDFY